MKVIRSGVAIKQIIIPNLLSMQNDISRLIVKLTPCFERVLLMESLIPIPQTGALRILEVIMHLCDILRDERLLIIIQQHR